MKYMTFNGRLGRGGYIAAIFIASIISAVIFVALWFFEILDEESARRVMYLTAAVLMICPAVQRLHDTDHSGAGLLIALIPIINLGLGLYLLLKPGTPGPNLYGNRTDLPDTQPRDSDDIAKENKPIVPPGIKETNVIHHDAFYGDVAKEMQENRLIPGVWARAFAEADGDKNRAKAIYIKYRILQLEEDRLSQEGSYGFSERARRSEAGGQEDLHLIVPVKHQSDKNILKACFLALCLLSFVSVFSFNPADISLLHDPPSSPAHNLLGSFGAWFAFSGFLLFGAAGYFIPFLFLVGGILISIRHAKPTCPIWLWLAVGLIAVSGLIEFQPTLTGGLSTDNFGSPGGLIGGFLAVHILGHLIGRVGAQIVFVSLIFLSIQRLVRFYRSRGSII